MRCENCPAGWEDRSYEGECNDCGCLIYGHGLFNDNCRLSKDQIMKRLAELDEYEHGRIDRPQWVANRFLRELDDTCSFNGEPSYVSYPPERMRKGVYYPLYGTVDMHYQRISDYRRGYEDAKAGKEYNDGSNTSDASEESGSVVFA